MLSPVSGNGRRNGHRHQADRYRIRQPVFFLPTDQAERVTSLSEKHRSPKQRSCQCLTVTIDRRSVRFVRETERDNTGFPVRQRDSLLDQSTRSMRICHGLQLFQAKRRYRHMIRRKRAVGTADGSAAASIRHDYT